MSLGIKTILTVALAFCLYRSVPAQQVSLNVRDASVKETMETLHQQYGYSFIFESNDLDSKRKITLNEKDVPVEMLVGKILAGQNVAYHIDGKNIVVKKNVSATPERTGSYQGIAVAGVVTDDAGQPLAGATIALKGAATGVVSDANGKYSITVPGKEAVLVFSFVGFATQEIEVGDRTVVDVTLSEGAQEMEEVVVVGYGVQRRKDVTGSVVSFKTEQIQNMPQTNIVQAIQGKMAGVQITNVSSSVEGQDTKIRVRAQNSINADASPLIVLDGIPYSGFLSEISPSDIESIDILKDASSAAIYGARAANGVMLITTKRGVKGKTRIQLDGFVGVDNYANLPEMMSGEEFYHFKKERKGFVTSFEQDQYDLGRDTKWVDLATHTGVRQEYNLSVSGATDEINYFVATNIADLKGIAINDVYNRYTVRLNLEAQISTWLKYGTNTLLGYYRRDGEKANFATAMVMSPLTIPYAEDGSINFHPWTDDPSVRNPLEPLNYTHEDVARSVVTTNYLHIDFPFLKGLSYRLNTGYNYRTRLIEEFRATHNTLEGEQKGGVATVNNQGKEDWTLENIVDYNAVFQKHSIRLTAVYSAQQFTQKYHDNTGVGFPGDFQTYYQFKLATTLTPGDTYVRTANLSQMLRLNYSFNSRYMLTLTARRDGYSAFGSDTKFGLFPSVGVGWNMEQESFMGFSKDWLYRLKLRLSYGENGNQAINAYESLPTMTNEYYLDNSKNPLIGYYSNKLADPTLGWETTRQFNAGLDYAFLDGRISGSIDAYRAHTYDLLLNKQIPQINGVSTIRQNVGETSSYGVEFQISSVNVKKKNFAWITDFNISHYRNKILNVGLFDEDGNALDNLGNRWFIGEPIRVIYSYVFDGIWQEDDDIIRSHMPTAKPGDVRVKDIGGPDGSGPDDAVSTDGHC
jgi:TonB-linked SusC/RagA family outer membrane protein